MFRGCLGGRRGDQKSLKEHKRGNYRTLTINEAGGGWGGLLKYQRDKRERGLVQVNCVVIQPISSVLPPSLRSLR